MKWKKGAKKKVYRSIESIELILSQTTNFRLFQTERDKIVSTRLDNETS